MVRYSVILSKQTADENIPVGVAGFYDYDDAVDYATDWPGHVDVVDFETGELIFATELVPGDDGNPS